MSKESWGRSITPNEEPWVGELIDAELAKRDAAIEQLRKDVTHWREARRSCIQAGDMMKAEIERLSLALANAKISFDAIDATLAERDAEIERLRERNTKAIEVRDVEIERLRGELAHKEAWSEEEARARQRISETNQRLRELLVDGIELAECTSPYVHGTTIRRREWAVRAREALEK